MAARLNRPIAFALFIVLSLAARAVVAQAPPLNLMPVPASVRIDAGGLPITSQFSVGFSGYKDERLLAAAARMVDRVSRQTGIPMLPAHGVAPTLTVTCACSEEARQLAGKQKARGASAVRVPRLQEDESYTLNVTASGATLAAATSYGVLRGLETFAQLVEPADGAPVVVGSTPQATGFVVRAASIEDRPRFPWRGLMIDAGRHWQPMEVIKRNLDAMSAVKLNVFHWHLSEDQGFRVESKVYPKLQQLGSDGHYYTQAQVREIVRYAADRGIRVVPEFDVPGHTGSWLVAYPQLAAGPGPYEIQRHWGVFDPVLDPTNEQVYVVLDRLFGEMAALFPDAYFHIGGDEVNGKQWGASPKIQAFMKSHGFKTNGDLHTYFNKRLNAILRKHHKIMVGWDEVLNPGLPKDIVVQSWRGQKALAETARGGNRAILSNGYYLDYMWSAERHYLVDPIGENVGTLTDEEKARILGGEATMWSEWTSPEMIDSRIWPRTAAIAERYWSPASVRDVEDMYRRLGVVSRRLDFTGVTHRTAYLPMLERMTGGKPAGALKGIVDLVEPVREYNRGRGLGQTQQSPLTRLIDAARPESEEARRFARLVDAFVADRSKANRDAIERSLRGWQDDAAAVQPLLDGVLLQEARPLVQRVAALSALALRALQALDQGKALPLAADDTALLADAAKPTAEVHLMIVPAVRKLLDAAPK